MKRIISIILSLSMLLGICAITPVYAQTQSYVWSFENDGSTDGWAANKGSLSVANGVMTHTVNAGNNNAFLLSPKELDIKGADYPYVKIKLKNNNCASTAIVVSFTTTEDAAFDASYSSGTKTVITTGIAGYDNAYTEYVIDMSGNESWTNGTITRFRLLTFLNNTNITAGSMDIEYIKVTPAVEDEEVLPGFYVSSSAVDGGDGSNLAPWNSLDDVEQAIAAGKIVAGDTVYLERGSVFEENFVPTVSGNSTDWITISAYGEGSKPVIAPGQDAQSPFAIYLEDVYGYKFMNLEIRDARAGIRVINRNVTDRPMDGLWIENCYIHNIHGIEPPKKAVDIEEGSDYMNSIEDDQLFMSYGISLFKVLGNKNRSFDNVTIKNCYVTDVGGPLLINYANNAVIEDCVFSNSYNQGILFSNVSDPASGVENASRMSNCKVYNMGYNGGMYWGVAGVQFNSCNNFTMESCDIMYTGIGGTDHVNDEYIVPDGIGIDYEGANKNVTVKGCNVVGNMDSGFLIMQNQKWAKESPNLNSSIIDCYFANNRLRAYSKEKRDASFARIGHTAQVETSGEISGNTVVKRYGQSALTIKAGGDDSLAVLTDDFNLLASEFSYTVGENTIKATTNDAIISIEAPETVKAGEEFEVAISADKAIEAEKTELYVDAEVYAEIAGLADTVAVTENEFGMITLMAKVTLANGEILYSEPLRITASSKTSDTEKFAQEWIFEGSVNGWFSNKASKAGSKALYIQDKKMVYYLSEDSSEGANTNNFLLSPNNLGIDGSKYKYIKIRMKNTTNLAGDLGVSFVTTDNTTFPSKWSDTVQAKRISGVISAEDSEFKEYVIDMSDMEAWTSSTVTRIRLIVNAYTIEAGNSGDILIESIKISNKGESSQAPQITPEPTDEPPTDRENIAVKWSFAQGTQGWASNKGAKTGGKPLYINNGTLEYYLSDDTTDNAHTNNFLVSPKNLGIDADKYKYIKILLRSELPVTGDIGVRFAVGDGEIPSSWTDSEAVINMPAVMTASDDEFKCYVIDMSGCAAWTGVVNAMQIKTNPYNIEAGNAGTVHIASISVSDSDKVSETEGLLYEWNFDIAGSIDSWITSATKAALEQKDGKLAVSLLNTNAAILSPANIAVNGAKYPYIHIVMKSQPGTNKQKIQWTTSDDTTWNADTRYLERTWETADGYTHYVYDMSSFEEWNGKTITRLQFYPASNLGGGTIMVDKIAISGDPAFMYEDNSFEFSMSTDESVSGKAVISQDKAGKAKGILAQYDDDGRLLGVLSDELSFDANTQTVFDMSMPISEGASTAKAFIWDSIDSIKPICESGEKGIIGDSILLYSEPFWNSEVMVNESLTMIKNEDGTPAQAPLYYTPTEVVSVRDSKLSKEYVEGVDYVIEGNILKLTENSRIFSYDYTDIYPNEMNSNTRKTTDGKIINCTEGSYFHQGQIAVTYRHAKDTEFVGQTYQGDKLPNTMTKLENGMDVNILLYGDSISSGANMSGKSGSAPWLPVYGQLYANALAEKYGSQVTFTNISKAGQTSKWGAENAQTLISGKNPDLLIIAFGMNDGTFGSSLDEFKTNTESIIATAKSLYPECEIVLIATTLPNEKALRADGKSLFIGNHREQPAILKEVAQETGSVFVNMTSVHDQLLTNKRFVDMTGNYTNHPNDFLGRMYVQSLMEATVK